MLSSIVSAHIGPSIHLSVRVYEAVSVAMTRRPAKTIYGISRLSNEIPSLARRPLAELLMEARPNPINYTSPVILLLCTDGRVACLASSI